MGSMSLKNKEFLRDRYADIDFYDKDLTDALMQHNLVKGSGKK